MEMYSPDHSRRHAGSPHSADDFLMFGYYIGENIGIAFQTLRGHCVWGRHAVFPDLATE